MVVLTVVYIKLTILLASTVTTLPMAKNARPEYNNPHTVDADETNILHVPCKLYRIKVDRWQNI